MSDVAGEVKVIIAADATTYSAALVKVKAQLAQLEGAVGTAGATTKKTMREAQGSIAVLGEEIGVTLPRHVRSFVAGMPGVARAMSAAFSAVAVIAIGEAIFEAGKKLYEFGEKAEKAAERHAEAWRAVENPLRNTNDALRLANDKLENSIAKIEHKPQNGLKEAIDAAIVSADTLGDKLSEDARKIAETVKAQSPGFLDRVSGGAGSGDVTGRAKTLQGDLDDIEREGRAHLAELRKQGADQKTIDAATHDLNNAWKARVDKELGWANGQLVDANKVQAAVGAGHLMGRRDQTGRIDVLKGYSNSLGEMSDLVALTGDNAGLQGRQAKAQAAAGNEAAARDAAAKQMAAFRQQLDAVKAEIDVSADMEAKYWQGLADSVKKNAPLYALAVDEANKATKTARDKFQSDLMRGWMEADRQYHEQNPNTTYNNEAALEQLKETSSAGDRRERQFDAGQLRAARESFDASAAEIKASEQIAEATVRLMQERGRLSPLATALALSNIHSDSDQQWQTALGKLNAAGGNVSASEYNQHARETGVQGRLDADAVRMATVTGQLVTSLDQLEQAFTDAGSMVRDTLMQAISGFNDTVLRMLTEPAWQRRGSWDQLGSQVFSGIAKTGLQAAEGQVLKALGFGGKKADGYHVWVDNLGGAGAASTTSSRGGLAGWLLGLFGHMGASGGGGAAGDMSSMADWSGVAGDNGVAGITIGGDAVSTGLSGSSARALPMASASAITPGKGAAGMRVAIDARGSQDPAAVEAGVHRAMRSYLPQMRNLAVSAVRDDRRRAAKPY